MSTGDGSDEQPTRVHKYGSSIRWTGNRGTGTSSYREYERQYDVAIAGKPTIAGSSDPMFRGDPGRHNPEDLLVSAAASCHMLWYLHLCADAGVVVVNYVDDALGTMVEHPNGSGVFTEITLRPQVTIAPGSDPDLAERLHVDANRMCPLAASLSFPVRHEPVTRVAGAYPS